MQNIEIAKYKKTMQKTWNDFISSSKNGFFMFNRNFMEYHEANFTDHSLVFFLKAKIQLVINAAIPPKTCKACAPTSITKKLDD